MITVVFDTETSGFPNWSKPDSDPAQPHLVQLAVVVADGDGVMVKWDTIVKCPFSATIAPGAEAVHGISADRSRREGIDLKEAIAKFDGYVQMADRVVCHNAKFDFKIMGAAYYRAGVPISMLITLPRVCTMLTATPVLKIHSNRGYKWPKLQEVYKTLVDEKGFDAAHSADADTFACWEVLCALEKMGVELQ